MFTECVEVGTWWLFCPGCGWQTDMPKTAMKPECPECRGHLHKATLKEADLCKLANGLTIKQLNDLDSDTLKWCGTFQQHMTTPALPDKARELALQYHVRTESFDRSVCRGRRDGIAIPDSGHERAMINRNARAVRKDIEDQAERQGINRKTLQACIVGITREQILEVVS